MIMHHTVSKPPPFVFECLSNMKMFAAVHPVVGKIESTQSDTYRFYETLRLGPLSFAFNYPAFVCSNKEQGNILMKAVIFNYIRLDVFFHIKAEKEFSKVEEEIKFKAWWPVKSIMKKIIIKHHKRLFKNISNLTHA